jgi:transposase
LRIPPLSQHPPPQREVPPEVRLGQLCSHCGHENRTRAHVCGHCGEAL